MEMSTAQGCRRSSQSAHLRPPAAVQSSEYQATPLRRGPRGALFVHIASFVIPRRVMPRNVMSRRMTRLGTVAEGCA
jgi:hypothetical protein